MDTKSTKIRNSRAIKLIVIFLSVLIMFYGSFIFEKMYSFYQSSGTSVLDMNKKSSVLGGGNTAFANEIKEDADRVMKLCSVYKSDEAVESGDAFANREAAIRKNIERSVQYDIREAKFDEIDSMYVYDEDAQCYTYPFAPIDQSLILKDFSSEDQVRADNRVDSGSGRGTTTVDGKEYYKGYPMDQVVVDETSIRNSYESDMQAQIISERAEFRAEYESIKKHLSKLQNFQYYFVDKATGVVYTNMKVGSIEEAAKNMDGYTACIQSGDLRVSEEITDMIEASGGHYSYSNYYDYADGEEFYDSSYYNSVFTGSTKFDVSKYDAYIHVNTNEKTLSHADEYFDIYTAYEKQFSEVNRNIASLAICATLLITCLILIFSLSGNKNEDGTIKLAPIDKVPNSIHFILSVLIISGFVALGLYLYWDFAWENLQTHFTQYCLLSSAAIAAAMLVFEEWLMSTARQVKCHGYFKNTLIGKFIVPGCKRFVYWWNSEENRIISKSIKARILTPLVAYAIGLPILLAISGNAPFFYIPTIAISIVLIYYVVKLTVGLASIDSALTDAEQGNFNYNINVEGLPVAIKPLGEKTNNLTKGMKSAIDDAVRNERMKTELITNVSHDLKTPLTSIITYTDLLKMCDIKDPKSLEYISVLDEKSARLKKLIEDLVEASKASSGNVKLVLADININEMVEQIYGEYEDDLNSANLSLRCNFPENPVIAVADGQKTYRVIENLFSNTKKYAMPGTRVYLDVTSDDTFAIIDMKNISKDEMHFDTSNLAERFVRGDESRSTEGSGLGLSIAKSLTELQGGQFRISTDGDLFKVVIKLPLAKTSKILEKPFPKKEGNDLLLDSDAKSTETTKTTETTME